MKKLYWIIIAIVIAIALAEGYALYNIPKVETLTGQLSYADSSEIEPDTTFILSLESRAQGESEFSVQAVFDERNFNQFPQHFEIPILSKTLSNIGIYRLRAKVVNNKNVLYVNKGLLPLTHNDLSQMITIEMQIPVKGRKMVTIAAMISPTPIIKKPVITTPSPIKVDVNNLLGNKQWLLQTKQLNKAYLNFDIDKGYAFGSGGCNKFQGGYQITDNKITFSQFIASSKQCDSLMEVEDYFLSSLTKVTNWLVKQEGKQLLFFDENDQLLLQFTAQ